MTYYDKLLSYFNEKQSITGLRGNVRESVKNLLYYGTACTGDSGRRTGGWTYRNVWTDGVHRVLTLLKIPHEYGNNAPRGGASGEYVKITSPAFLKRAKEALRVKKEREERERIEKEARWLAEIAEEKAKEKARRERAGITW